MAKSCLRTTAAYRAAPVLFSGAIALFVLACSGGRDGVERNLDELRSEINRLQSEQDRLVSRLGVLETSSAVNAPNAAASGSASPETGGERPPLKVVVLQPPPAETDTDTIDSEEPVQVVRAYGSDVSTTGRSKAKRGSFDAAREYEDALGSIKKRQYDRAIEQLSGFLVRYPGDDRADNALFWLGDCYLNKGDADKAKEQFEGVLARFPKGNKAPDALLKLAQIAKQKGDANASKEFLRRLKTDYPSSDAARRAPKE